MLHSSRIGNYVFAGLSFDELDTKFWRRRRVARSPSDVVLRTHHAYHVKMCFHFTFKLDPKYQSVWKDKTMDVRHQLPCQKVLVHACLRSCRSVECTAASRHSGWFHFNLDSFLSMFQGSSFYGSFWGTQPCRAVYQPDPVNPMSEENKNLRKYADMLSPIPRSWFYLITCV